MGRGRDQSTTLLLGGLRSGSERRPLPRRSPILVTRPDLPTGAHPVSQTAHFPARNPPRGQVSAPMRLDRVDDVEQGLEQDLTGLERGDQARDRDVRRG